MILLVPVFVAITVLSSRGSVSQCLLRFWGESSALWESLFLTQRFPRCCGMDGPCNWQRPLLHASLSSGLVSSGPYKSHNFLRQNIKQLSLTLLRLSQPL